MKLNFLSALFVMTASGALVGTAATAAPSAPVMAPASPQVSWTGPYIGASIGAGSLDQEYMGRSSDHDLTEYGAIAGYNVQLGGWVLGGELGFYPLNIKDYSYDGSIVHLRGRLGYAFGRVLPYIAYGVSRMKIEQRSDDGASYGAGLDYMISDHLVLGAEYSLDIFDNYDDISTMDLKVRMAQLLLTYQF